MIAPMLDLDGDPGDASEDVPEDVPGEGDVVGEPDKDGIVPVVVPLGVEH